MTQKTSQHAGINRGFKLVRFETFDEAKRWKDDKGRAEHRPDGGPFVGDEAQEAQWEPVDFANYADRLLMKGRIDEDECANFNRRCHALWMDIQMIIEREDTQREPEPLAPHRASCGIW